MKTLIFTLATAVLISFTACQSKSGKRLEQKEKELKEVEATLKHSKDSAELFLKREIKEISLDCSRGIYKIQFNDFSKKDSAWTDVPASYEKEILVNLRGERRDVNQILTGIFTTGGFQAFMTISSLTPNEAEFSFGSRGVTASRAIFGKASIVSPRK